MAKKAITIEHVWKNYRLRHQFEGPSSSMKELLNAPFNFIQQKVTKKHNQPQTNNIFWAIKDVSLEIDHGESVGIIGRNGAGKSTLLKILSRITRPSKGRVLLHEKVNSLLEIGTGFNADLSGRDNVYLNGSFLGMKKTEIDQNFDQIVDFSGIEKFIDTPVKYYSSGMYVRLAFSVAVHLIPETLLLDEVLAVGDAEFKEKSNKKMMELLSSGATIILVSHSEEAIKEICKRTIWLEQGELMMDGISDEVVREYNQFIKKGHA